MKGETATASNTNIEELKKEHPLLAVLQLNQSGVGCIVGYADYKDTADVNRILNMKAVKEVMPRDLKLMWGVKASDMDKTDVSSNCMLSSRQNVTVVHRWKVM